MNGPYTERQKIVFILSYMKSGVALPWAEQRIDELECTGFLLMWTQLKVELKNAFRDTDRGVTA